MSNNEAGITTGNKGTDNPFLDPKTVVKQWSEKTESDYTKGLQISYLDEHMENFNSALAIEDEMFSNKIVELFHKESHIGAKFTWNTGRTYNMTIVHCWKEKNGKVSFAYIFNSIELEFGVQPTFKRIKEYQFGQIQKELTTDNFFNFLRQNQDNQGFWSRFRSFFGGGFRNIQTSPEHSNITHIANSDLPQIEGPRKTTSNRNDQLLENTVETDVVQRGYKTFEAFKFEGIWERIRRFFIGLFVSWVM